MSHVSEDCPPETNCSTLEESQLAHVLPVEDLTLAAKLGRISPVIPPPLRVDQEESGATPDIFDQMARTLYRKKQRHILVTGLKGVGKTAMIRELARKAASGQIPFLEKKRFIWIDCQDVAPEDSRACLEAILANCSQEPNVIICLDGFVSLLRRPQCGTNKPFLRGALSRPGLQIIGVLSRWDYNDLIGSDAELSEYFTRIEIEEPQEEQATSIVHQVAHDLCREFSLKIDDSALNRAVVLSSSYMLAERLPAKAIRILRQACENVDYERTQLGNANETVTSSDIIRIVSEVTGIPETTLEGDVGLADFEAALCESVVGQERSIQAVASEMRRIKAGLTEPGKPASVMLFAGMTGVGKTELAKRIAELYSTSKRLMTYTMGNFTEPHSVSGIIGVPPGYVGHELGGRLVNELNSDPYAVFLLDEAEKAHPNVWKPFLNLFDEGWIVDQRGVKAYADRAIFILTTNAGSDAIAQMARSGKDSAEIEERVKTTLSKVRHERSSQPVFAPQFLARLRRIVVFNPLDESAMRAITQKIVSHVQRIWQQKRERHLEVSPDLMDHIAGRSHLVNEKSGGQEGGRIVRKLIADLIEDPVQNAATSRPADYKACRVIRVGMRSTSIDPQDETIGPRIEVEFAA